MISNVTTRTKALIIAAALLVMMPSRAAATDVATFLAKVQAAKHNMLGAFLSGEAKRMMAELSGSMKELRAERLRAEAAGGHGAYCPKGPASLTQDEQFAALNAIPPAQRAHMQVRDAFRLA